MNNTHILTGIVLVPVCIWCLFWLIPGNTVPPTSEHDLSPALVPSIAVGACLLTGLIMLVRALRASRSASAEVDEEFGEEATGIDARVLMNTLWWTLTTVVAWLLIAHVGFEPAMTLLLVAIMLYVGVRKPLTIATTSLLVPILLSQAAWYFFSTQMPGIWR